MLIYSKILSIICWGDIMKLKNEFVEGSKKISKKLEYLIYTNDTNLKELSQFIGINYPNFSRIRTGLKRGELPTLKFLIGISKFYKENFLEFLLI